MMGLKRLLLRRTFHALIATAAALMALVVTVAAADVKLVVNTRSHAGRPDVTKFIADLYSQKNPHVEFEVIVGNPESVRVYIASGLPVDVIAGEPSVWFWDNLLLDLTSYLETKTDRMRSFPPDCSK